MINDKDLERVKSFLQSEDSTDIKIGVGLAKEKGMNLSELAVKCFDGKWIAQLKESGVSDEILNKHKDIILIQLEEIFNNILKE